MGWHPRKKTFLIVVERHFTPRFVSGEKRLDKLVLLHLASGDIMFSKK